jgi:hypothetical protein
VFVGAPEKTPTPPVTMIKPVKMSAASRIGSTSDFKLQSAELDLIRLQRSGCSDRATLLGYKASSTALPCARRTSVSP